MSIHNSKGIIKHREEVVSQVQELRNIVTIIELVLEVYYKNDDSQFAQRMNRISEFIDGLISDEINKLYKGLYDTRCFDEN